MSDQTKPETNYPFVEVLFNPQEQVRPDATQIDGAFYVIPRNFQEGVGVSDNSFKAVLLDNSQSMAEENKIRDCRAGAEQALRTSVGPEDYFAVYSFNTSGRRLFPDRGKPVKGTPQNIAAAIHALQRLTPDDNTYISRGVEVVLNDFLSLSDCDECTCALLTDGANNNADSRNLNAVLAKIVSYRQSGKTFKVQPIAVGNDPSRDQLNLIVNACLAEPFYHIKPGFGRDIWGEIFTKIFNDLSAKKLRNVTIMFVDKPTSTTLLSFKQQRPTVLDMTDSAVTARDGEVISIQTGAWEDARRLYSFSLGVRKPMTRENMLAASLQIKYTIGRKEFVLDAIQIKVRWTNVDTLSRRIPAELAEARGITGSVDAISEGIKALERKDKKTATVHFQKAYDLAVEARDTAFIRDLGDYMDINASTGVVTVKALTNEDSLRLDSLSKRRPGEA